MQGRQITGNTLQTGRVRIWAVLRNEFEGTEGLVVAGILALAIVAGGLLRFYRLSDSYFYVPDTTVQVALVKTVVTSLSAPYRYYAPVGPALLLGPFLAPFGVTIFNAQILVALFSLLLAPGAYLALRVLFPSYRVAAALAALCVALNPMFVSHSRVLSWDNMQVLAGLAVVLTAYKLATKPRTLLWPAAFVVAAAGATLMKTPNVAVVGVAAAFVAVCRWQDGHLRLRDLVSRRYVVSALVLAVLVTAYFVTFQREARNVLTGAEGQYQLDLDTIGRNLRWSYLWFATPLDTESATTLSGSPEREPWQLTLGLLQLAVVGVGIAAGYVTQRRAVVLLALWAAASVAVYAPWIGWGPRYLLPLLFAMLVFFALGAESLLRRAVSSRAWFKVPVTFLILAFTAGVLTIGSAKDVAAVRNWDTFDSYYENNVFIFPQDETFLRNLLAQDADAAVVSVGASFITIIDPHDGRPMLDLQRLSAQTLNSPEAFETVRQWVTEQAGQGRNVYYLPLWHEIDNMTMPRLERGFGAYYEVIADTFSTSVVYMGFNTYRNGQPDPRDEPTFRVIRVRLNSGEGSP